MFRRFRHKLLWLLQAGILASGGLAMLLQPSAWRGVLLCMLGCMLAALVCGRVARQYLHASVGRLRRVADDIGRGRLPSTINVLPGDDMYKLTSAVNVLATRLADAAREEQRLHEELRRRERLAFLGELAASVAHEINNPLDGAQNCARILRRSQDNPQRAAQMLDLIDSGLARIEMIVRRLLTLSRDQAIRPADARLREVVAAALEMAGPKIEGRGVRVVQRVAAADDRACVDRPLLEQALVNLILNAADSMPSGGELALTIRDGTHSAVEPLRTLCLEVADTGSGISPDVLPHIFEPFFTTKTGGKGTGLGLAIASRIVDAHRGHITVAGREDGGTIFTICLPVTAAVPGAAADVALAAGRGGGSGSRADAANLRILGRPGVGSDA
jgi:signal transduction histidine kinase